MTTSHESSEPEGSCMLLSVGPPCPTCGQARELYMRLQVSSGAGFAINARERFTRCGCGERTVVEA